VSAPALRHARRLGGPAGNEILTTATAAVLVVLLLAEGVTILNVRGLLREHMFIGLMLIGPVALKLSSTGYRFTRYYTGSPPYRENGPPLTALRVLAPVLVATTVAVFATGVWLMALGHRSGAVLELHKIVFIVWGAMFGVHFLAYLPRLVRAARVRDAVPGGRARGLLVGASVCAGVALAVGLLGPIAAWRRPA